MKEEKKIYKVVVSPGLSLAKMIEAGKYDWFNHDINDKHFSLQGAGQHEVELELFHVERKKFPTYIGLSTQVKHYMNEQGLKQGRIEHLLALGSIYLDVQREFDIVALGSFFSDDGDAFICNYPYLTCDDNKRKLDLYWPYGSSDWDYHWRFLAIRKAD